MSYINNNKLLLHITFIQLLSMTHVLILRQALKKYNNIYDDIG